MKVSWRAISPLVAAAGVGAVLVAYILTHKRTDVELEIGSPTFVSTATDIVLPLDAYVLSRPMRRLNSTAVSILGRDCMRRLGFEWPIPDRTPPISEEPDNARRYGLVDERHAQSHGYHHDPAELEYIYRVKATSSKIPDDALKVWGGETARTGTMDVPEGGCGMEARRKLGTAPGGADERSVERLAAQTFAVSERHPRVQEALKQWATCMESSGFRYKNPFEAAADRLRGVGESSPPNDLEIATATADVACNRQANLAGVWLAVESAFQRHEIEANSTELSELKRWRDRVATESAQIVAAAPRD